MRKQTLIEMERVLGLYDEGLYLIGKALYPQDWQNCLAERPKCDRVCGGHCRADGPSHCLGVGSAVNRFQVSSLRFKVYSQVTKLYT